MAADETIKQLAKQRFPLVSHEAEKGICLVQAAPRDTQYYNMLQYCWHKMLQVLPPCYKYIIYKLDRVATHLQKK